MHGLWPRRSPVRADVFPPRRGLLLWRLPAYSRKVWTQSGGFDTSFLPAYYEETDYCMRLWQRGLRVVYEPDAHILHYEFASSASTSTATSMQARNQNVFAERHRSALETHDRQSPDRLVFARARKARGRILFIDDRVAHRWLGSGFPRANALIHALHSLGYFVTCYPIDVINEPLDIVYSDLPREVEVMVGMGPQMLRPFLGYALTITRRSSSAVRITWSC